MLANNLTTSLVILGAGLMLTAIISGIRLKRRIPLAHRDRWQLLILLMAFFFCGHLLFASLLRKQFPFPNFLIALSIFMGGLFALLVISLSSGALRKIKREQEALSKAVASIRLKDEKLKWESASREKTEKELAEANALLVKELFELISEVLANRDQYTFEHDMQVASISLMLGKKLGLNAETLASLELGCLAHDIGKTAIPDDILLKPAKFNIQDRNIMEYHPLIGAKLIARHLQDDKIIDIVLNHHERLDGSGYPAGLQGKEIGLLPRIVAVADTYEALVSKRPYKKSLSDAQALAVLEQEARDGRLDPEIVAALVAIHPELPENHQASSVTAGFMKDVEIFRNRSYFREPLSDFYNYRYLLFLDDAGMLSTERSYELILISFPNFGTFQQQVGYLVADQVFDEIGQELADTCYAIEPEDEENHGALMLFRKRNDYLIYQEMIASGEQPAPIFAALSTCLERYQGDWQLDFVLVRQSCPAGLPTSKALRYLLEKSLHQNNEKKLDNRANNL